METDANGILRLYTRLCNNEYAQLHLYVASNSALEWFGRTIRGRSKIFPFYRFDLCQQYEHDFEKSERCEPFECKPSHMQTKIVSEADKVSFPIKSKVTDETYDLMTTPLQRIATPILPKVDRGITFIPTPESSPKSKTLIDKDNKTPPQNIIKQGEEDDAPPIKRFRLEEVPDGCAGDSAGSHTSDHTVQADSKQEPVCSVFNVPELGQGDCILTYPAHSETKSASDTGYSDLMYLEAAGFLHTRNKLKHRGVTSTQTSSDSDRTSPVSGASSTNDLNQSHMRKTKLKISYRIRQDDNQVQFALIIYEHLARNPASKRNLLLEFQETKDDNGAVPDTKNNVSLPSAKKTSKSLKRSLRLF